MKSKVKMNATPGQVGQLPDKVRDRGQLVKVKTKPVKGSGEDRNQMSYQMPYLVRLVSCPIQSGTEVS